MHRTFLAAGVVGLAGLASAGGPTDFVSYQGQLKDNGANANGDYEFQFDLWTVANTSVLADSVTLTLNVENGLFNADLPFGDEFDRIGSGGPVGFELEIGARPAGSMDPFTVLPRQPVRNAARATYAERGTDTFGIGDVDGGRLEILDQMGTFGMFVEPDIDGSGQFLQLNGMSGSFVVNGTNNGSEGTTVTVQGGGEGIFLSPGTPVADEKVVLPADSIGSAEIGDEAGAAARSVQSSSTTLNTTDYVSIVSQTIDCPSDGYVLAIGNASLGVFNTVGAVTTRLAISLDGTTPLNNQFAAQFIDPESTGNVHLNGISTSQLIPVSAGSTTVHLIANTGTPGSAYYSAQSNLTLLFVPTAYGAVAERVTGGATTDDVSPPLPGTFTPLPTFSANPDEVRRLRERQEALEARTLELQRQLEAVMKQQAEANGR